MLKALWKQLLMQISLLRGADYKAQANALQDRLDRAMSDNETFAKALVAYTQESTEMKCRLVDHEGRYKLIKELAESIIRKHSSNPDHPARRTAEHIVKLSS